VESPPPPQVTQRYQTPGLIGLNGLDFIPIQK
jgi:hypothetical protein